MKNYHLIIFDDGAGRWGPLGDRRSACELRTGQLRPRERLERALGQVSAGIWVPEQLREVVAERNPGLPVNELPERDGGTWLAVNGRWVGGEAELAALLSGLKRDQAVVDPAGAVVALCAGVARVRDWLRHNELDPGLKCVVHEAGMGAGLIDRPWQILDRLGPVLSADLSATGLALTREEQWQGLSIHGDQPVRIAPSARLLGPVVILAEAGPVVVDVGAEVQPFTMLEGPCYIGPGTVIRPQATIRAHTVIGMNCRVGGEISASIMDDHSNKAHAGYLGDSLVGQWCNFGADTTVSNLKNTYGTVRVKLDDAAEVEETGRQRQGSIVGDFVRTAIGTRLMSGSVVGSASMIAVSGFGPKYAGPFRFLTDRGDAVHGLEELLRTAERMMERRAAVLSDAERRLLQALHRQACGQGDGKPVKCERG